MFFKKYIAYVKDNPEGYWFKRKIFGWGWTPVTWQGWLVTIGFILAILLNALCRDLEHASDQMVIKEVIAPTFVLAFILIAICYKTGEPPKWMWGIPDQEDNEKQ